MKRYRKYSSRRRARRSFRKLYKKSRSRKSSRRTKGLRNIYLSRGGIRL